MLTRALTAAVLLAAFLGALLVLGRPWFAVLIGAVLAIGAHEWGRLARLSPRAALAYAGVALALYAALAWGLAPLRAADPAEFGLFSVTAAFWLFLAPAWLQRGMDRSPGALLLAAGLVVLVPTGLAAIALSPGQLLLTLGLVWIADTAAYLAGRAVGRRRLAPRISPGKTWEGAAGGAVATIIYAIICALPGAPLGGSVQGAGWLPYLGATLLLCAVSIVGDLLESALKRQAGAKDSGALLPGHGGVLDRIDSATSTLPIAVLAFHWMSLT